MVKGRGWEQGPGWKLVGNWLETVWIYKWGLVKTLHSQQGFMSPWISRQGTRCLGEKKEHDQNSKQCWGRLSSRKHPPAIHPQASHISNVCRSLRASQCKGGSQEKQNLIHQTNKGFRKLLLLIQVIISPSSLPASDWVQEFLFLQRSMCHPLNS